ncbi:MAG: hypothetical protein U1E25_14655, partial [Methylocystis sp.]
MAGAYETVKILDKDGNEIDQRVFNEDAGNPTGARQIVSHIANPDGTTIEPAQEGVAGTGITLPSGSGLHGFLSWIYEKFTRPNDGSGTAAGKQHLTVGGSDGTNLWPHKMNTSGGLFIDADGAKINGSALLT